MHGRALQREAELEVENERLQRDPGFASSNSSARRPRLPRQRLQRPRIPAHVDAPPRQPRGEQRGGPESESPRFIPTSLPLSKTRLLLPDQCHCRGVVEPFADFPGTEDSTILEIDVRPIAESFAVAVID